MGDLSDADRPLVPLLVLAAGAGLTLLLARQLNLMLRGDLQARTLGVNTRTLTAGIFLLSSALTATAVTVAGSIGFVGLVVPHMFRLLAGSDHRWLIPGAVLMGGTLLLLADTLARTLIAPQQMPAGIITALLGVPVFLFLLTRRKGPYS
jgi:iron complex transport system permease protein